MTDSAFKKLVLKALVEIYEHDEMWASDTLMEVGNALAALDAKPALKWKKVEDDTDRESADIRAYEWLGVDSLGNWLHFKNGSVVNRGNEPTVEEAKLAAERAAGVDR